MVRKIRANDLVDPAPYLGDKGKELEGAQNQFRPYFNKALVVGMDIPAATEIKPEMIFAMRPVSLAGGLPSYEYPNVLGRMARIALKKYDPITWDVLT